MVRWAYVPVVKAHCEPLEVDVRTRERRCAHDEYPASVGDSRRVGTRVTKVEAGAFELETVTAAVDDTADVHARPHIPERPARQNHETDPLARREARERCPNRGRERRRARRRDDRRQRPVVVQDREEAGAAPERVLKAREETGGEAQEDLATAGSTGIRASSLSSSPAHR